MKPRYDEFGSMQTMHTFRSLTPKQAASLEELDTETADAQPTRWIFDEATGLLTGKRDATNLGNNYASSPRPTPAASRRNTPGLPIPVASKPSPSVTRRPPTQNSKLATRNSLLRAPNPKLTTQNPKLKTKSPTTTTNQDRSKRSATPPEPGASSATIPVA